MVRTTLRRLLLIADVLARKMALWMRIRFSVILLCAVTIQVQVLNASMFMKQHAEYPPARTLIQVGEKRRPGFGAHAATLPALPSYYYRCGYPKDYILHLLYPELRSATAVDFPKDKNNSSKNDFLVLGEHGFCHGWGRRKLGPDHFRLHFPGTTIIVNGESVEHGGQEWEMGFFLGYKRDSWRHIQVYFVAMVLARLPVEIRNRILVPSQKPINTGERFLVYAASNPVEFRQRAFDAMAEIDVVYQGGKTGGLNYTASKSKRVKLVEKRDLDNEWPKIMNPLQNTSSVSCLRTADATDTSRKRFSTRS